MSTLPALPNAAAAGASLASSASSPRPDMTKIRGAMLPSPGQYETPRREGAPPATGVLQICRPEVVSSATTASAVGRYIEPPITIGVACEFTAAVAPAEVCAPDAAPSGNVHARFSRVTLLRSISASGE